MVTILLEQIIELLKGFIESFKDHAAEVAEKLGLISEDTSDINDNTDTIVSLNSSIKDNTDILVANTGAIKNSSQATSVNTAAIASDTNVIRNNINTISVNSGRTAAFTEDTATNTLNTLNKVTTIASDTTEIRHIDTNIYSRLNSMYTQLDWLLYGVDFINETSGASPVVFNTDKPFIPIKKIASDIVPIQTGSGIPSPDNIRPISGFSSANIGVNNNIFNIPFNQTVYGGVVDVTSGKLTITHKLVTYNGSENWQFINPSFYIATPNDCRISQTPIANEYNGVSPTYYNVMVNGNIALSTVLDNLLVRNDSIASVADFKTALANNPLTVLYKLAIPVEISITPISVEQSLGDNIITTNTNGDLTITYIESVRNHVNS